MGVVRRRRADRPPACAAPGGGASPRPRGRSVGQRQVDLRRAPGATPRRRCRALRRHRLAPRPARLGGCAPRRRHRAVAAWRGDLLPAAGMGLARQTGRSRGAAATPARRRGCRRWTGRPGGRSRARRVGPGRLRRGPPTRPRPRRCARSDTRGGGSVLGRVDASGGAVPRRRSAMEPGIARRQWHTATGEADRYVRRARSTPVPRRLPLTPGSSADLEPQGHLTPDAPAATVGS